MSSCHTPTLLLRALLMAVFVLTAGFATDLRSETYQADPQNMTAQLSKAQPGDTILLAPGAYDVLWLKRDFGGVTLKSADPAAPAKFTALKVKGARGLTLEDLVFDYTYTLGDNKKRLKVSQITSAQNITLRRVLFDGDIATGTGTTGDGFGASFGLTIRKADNILIEQSRFHQWYRGMVVSESNGIVLRGSEFHAMRSDGADFAAVEDVLLENNYFHDFQRDAKSKDHPDMIQFWTNGTTRPNRNITIRNNVLSAGSGAWTQSIFMRNEVVDSQGGGAEMFYRNLSITGNVIINGHLHGITVGETNGLMIADNTLVRNHRARFTDGKAALHTPTIRIAKKSQNVLVTRNIVSKIVGQDGQSNWRVGRNLQVQYSNPAASGHYDAVFVSALQGDPANLASFAYLPQGPAAQAEVGAPLLRLTHPAWQNAVLVQATRDARFVQRFEFDAGLSPGVSGADIRWEFSDGTTATGPRVAHSFPTPGRFAVIARAPGARPARLNIQVPDPQVLRFDAQGLQVFTQGSPRQVKGTPLSTLPDGRTVLSLGQGGEVFKVGGQSVAGFFGASDLALDLRLRTAPTQNPAGEILRIHNNLIVSMSSQGQIVFWLNTAETPKPVSIATGPLRLHDGNWHDISLRYSAEDGRMSVIVNGAEQARAQARGRLRPLESWGLTFGNPFGKKSFDGMIAHLDLRVNTAGFAPR